MRYRWQLPDSSPQSIRELAARLGVSPLLAQCLHNRQQQTAEHAARYLEPRLKDLSDPFLLPDMSQAVDRLDQARSTKETVVVFGDYDVDGVSATALLVETLTQLGLSVRGYLPQRLTDGYGLSDAAVERCLQEHRPSLLIAVDCGTTSSDTIQRLQQSGVDVIVLDHHQPGPARPPALALINPHCAGSQELSSTRALCATGLAFKFSHALVKHGRQENWAGAMEVDVRGGLDLVALATIADLVPLTGENRILVNRGLDRLRNTRRVGLRALREVAGVGRSLGGYEVAFQLAPRLNAAGRLETAQAALQLLTTASAGQAQALAQQLDAQNRERQSIERAIASDLIHSIRARFDPERDYVIVEGSEGWHVGVVGIVASRVMQEFYRPAVILGGCGEGPWRGSCRSIEGFDIGAALGECRELVVRAGGHGMAAGLSLLPSNLGQLRERLNLLAKSTLMPHQLRPALALDAEVWLEQLTVLQVGELRRLETTGVANPPVRLCLRGLSLAGPPRRLGPDQRHLKQLVRDTTASAEVVWWGAGDAALPAAPFDLACTPQLNEFRGEVTVQLKLLDFALTEQPEASQPRGATQSL